ncbi:MAG TPA: ABC transporter ATP-binding protein [Acidimicrobiales bacterium]|nr:ABC transporter ATP-binding protein [Acidimicrobiales bacterium]
MRVTVTDLRVAYDGHEVVSGVSFALEPGGWLCLIGPNGSGKTTLLRALGGLREFGGEVRFDDEVIATQKRRRLARSVAYVPQRPVLPATMTVRDYVLLGRTPYIAFFGSESRHDRAVATEVLDRLDLTGFAARGLGSLSGGEAQRAVLGRALAQQAPLLLLDEPTAALDPGHGQHVLELVDTLREERQLTVISAMHDLTLAGQFADRLALIAAGRIIADGTARAVLNEKTLARHYGAELRVIEDGLGGIVVLPRPHPRRARWREDGR